MDKWEELSTEAMDYHQKGDLAKAEELFSAAVESAEQYGEDDPRLANCLDNLAWILQTRNKLAEAEPVLKRSLAIMERSKGPDHEDNSWILATLGNVCSDLSKFEEAETYFRKAISVNEKALGPVNLNVAVGLEKLADVLRKTDRGSEAETMENRAKEIRANLPPPSGER
jgi:tetratricopeptide (TPR) repeat protein